MIQEPKRHLAMLSVGLLYGGNYSILKVVTPEFLTPFSFIVTRVGIATLAFWLIGLFAPQKVDWKRDGLMIFLCAFFGMGVNMLLFFKGVSLTSAINASLIMTLTPIMVFVCAIFILKEKLTKWKSLGLLIGLGGALLIAIPESSQGYGGNWVGDIMVLLNALTYGAYLVLVKPLLSKYEPVTIAKWGFLIGFFIVLPFGFQDFIQITWENLPTKVYWSMFYSIIGVTVVVYIINIWAMKKVSPSTVGSYIYVQPVFATLIALIFFGEAFLIKHVIAAALVFVGVAMVIRQPSR
ncbi:MAG: DMT family transporter [Cyclobacteriaceae bacterium]